MTALRLIGRPVTPVDLVLVRSAERIVRVDGTLWVEGPAASRAELRRGLAFAGVGAVEEDAPTPRSDLIQSVGLGLAPAPEPVIEILSLRLLPHAESTGRALGSVTLRRLVPRYRAARHRACRDLLRGADELVCWERRAWLTASALRRSGVRRSFRPIVFDRDALTSPRLGGLASARSGAITQWAFE